MANIQSVYVAIFGRPADPAGLVYWNAETNNGADLSSIIGNFSASDEFKALYDGKTNTEVVTAIYQSLFGRDPEDAGLQFYLKGLEDGSLSIESIAISIIDGAQGTDKTIVENKIVAANAFTAQLDAQQEIDAYAGTAAADVGRDYLKPITEDPATIPTSDGTDATILTLLDPDAGQEPGGDGAQAPGGGAGGGTVEPTPLSFLERWTPLDNEYGDTDPETSEREAVNIEFLKLGVEYAAYLEAGGEAFIDEIVKTNEGGRSQSLHDNLLGNINKAEAEDPSRNLGDELAALVSANPEVAKYLERPYFDGNLESDTAHAAESFAFDIFNDVNRGDIDADGFLEIWTPLDADYGKNEGGDLVTNTAFVHLGAAYAKYLDEGGSSADFASVKVKDPGHDSLDDGIGRYQTLHDNLLGNITETGTAHRDLGDLAKVLLGEERLDFHLFRDVYSGNEGDWQNDDHDSVRIFDYERGFDREDYVFKETDGVIDSFAQNDGNLFAGTGNSVENFNITRHEGAGIEIALKTKIFKGADIDESVGTDGVTIYNVTTGKSDKHEDRADWSFDASVATGLNDSSRSLDDYSIRVFIDIDPTIGVSFVGGENGLNILGFDTVFNSNLVQLSQNYAFDYIKSGIDIDPIADGIQAYEYGEAEFDIQIKAFDGDVELLSNNIRVIVDDFIAT